MIALRVLPPAAIPHLTRSPCALPSNAHTQVINSATPASDIKDLLHNDIRGVLPLDSDIDLILVDFGINDAVLDHFDFDLENVKRAHEVFIRYVKIDMVNSPAMLYAENYIHPLRVLRAPEQGDNMARVHADVARKHDIPMVGYSSCIRRLNISR